MLTFLSVTTRPILAEKPPETDRLSEVKYKVKYKIEVPLKEDEPTPESPVTAVTIFPGGADPDELLPVVKGPTGKRRAAEFLWARKNEPIRVVFDTSQTFQSVPSSANHAIYILSLARDDRVDDGPGGTRRQGLTLETKNFGPSVAGSFDHSSLKAFTELWNESPEVDGRSLVEKVQHGYPLHQPYGDTPREYLPNMGAPLSLHRYRGYFRVTKPDRSKIDEFRKKAKKKLQKVKELERKLKKLQQEVQIAKKALKAAKKKDDKNAVENRKTALEEWQFRLKKMKKKTLPEARNEFQHADAAISEIQNNTYSFLTGSKGASWVLINGQEVAHWPADEELPRKGDEYYGYNEGAINLKPGIHKVEYLYAATGKDYLTFMLWRHPAEKKPKIMKTDMFGNVGEARVTNARTGDGARPPAWKLLKDSRISGVPDFVLTKFWMPVASKEKKNFDDLTYRWRFGDGSTAEGAEVNHLYLESGTYDVTLEAYEQDSNGEPLWSVRQPVRVHVPYELKEFIKTAKLKKLIRGKDLSVYPVRHLLNALKAVEKLDPNRLSHNRWRRDVLRELAKNVEAFAEESVDWTLRAGEMSLSPTVALYEEAFQFFEAATNAMKPFSPRWHRTKLREAQAHLLVRDTGKKGLEMLRNIEPNQHQVAPGNLMGWWSFSSRPYMEAQVPDLSRNDQNVLLQGGNNAKIVEEETRSALELNGKEASLLLPIRPPSVKDQDGDGSELLRLDGTGSSDADGTISSYSWTKDGKEIATGDSSGVSLEVGNHDITLTVTDNDGNTDSDTINVTVGNTGILHYTLDEGSGSTANDHSGSNHDGTLSGPVWSSSTPDGSNSSLSFDGSNDYVAINNLNYNSSGHAEVTVTAWVKTSDGSDQILASFDRSEYWRLEINGSGAGTGKVGWDLTTDSGQLDFGGSTRIDDGTWHHVAAVYDKGKATLYIDGQKDASTNRGNTFGTGNTRYGFIGTGSEATSADGNNSPGNHLNGSLDDVRIYKTALPASRIKDLASPGSSRENNSSTAKDDSSTSDEGTSGSGVVMDSDSDPDGDPDSKTGEKGTPTARASLDHAAYSSFTLSMRLKLMEPPGKNNVLIDDENFTLSLEEGVPKIESRPDNFIERAEKPLEPEQWYNLVLMRTAGKRMRLFVDGVEEISQKISNSKPYLRELRVGEGKTRLRLSDIRLYKGSLTRVKRLDLTVDRQWFRAHAEALLSAGQAEEAANVVEKWASITERIIPPEPVQESATVQRIKSLIQKGSDQALLAAQEKINDLIQKTPRRLLSGEFNITILDMYLGRGANRVAANLAERLLNLQLASAHTEKIMERRVRALARLGDMEEANDAFDKLEEEYPYSDALRTARKVLEKHE